MTRKKRPVFLFGDERNEPMMRSKPGRPATDRGAYNPHKARQLGRVSDEDWEIIRAACEQSGLSLVAWALPTLLNKAKRERSKACAAAQDAD